MVHVWAASWEPDSPLAKTPRLALHPPELGPVVDYEVVTGVFTERQENREPEVV